MIAISISAIIIAYVLLILVFWLGWEKSQPSVETNDNLLSVSIIIPVRNEAKNIGNLLADIGKQTYPKHLLEVIVVDDHSTDATNDEVSAFIKKSSNNLRLISMSDEQGKKSAIKKAVGVAANEIILTTDGDCRANPAWVATMAACFTRPKIQLVSGPVRMNPQTSMWQRIQAIEFSSLISAGAATISLGWPTMANGANLAFRKTVFVKYNDASNNSTSSGDDVFLLHNISRDFTKAIVFCRERRAIIDTETSNAIGTFYSQRQRWAGKWQFYHDIPTILLALFVFLVNLTIVSIPILVILKMLSIVLAANLLVVKFVFEFLFLREVQKFFKTRFLLHEFIILAFIYPVYVTIMALSGLIGKYKWKDRTTR